MKVFLGGTCNGSTWREHLISELKIDYFDPVVSDWTEGCKKREIEERKICDFCLYVITPEQIGWYSIAEAVDDSNKIPEKTLFCVLDVVKKHRFSAQQVHSLEAVASLIRANGGRRFYSLYEVAIFLNRYAVG